MILWNQKLKKTIDLFRGVESEFRVRDINIDGVIESFNNGKEQGLVLVLYNKYNPNLDVCLWAYLPKERDCNNQMRIVVGKSKDRLPDNTWGEELYSEVITEKTARALHDKAREKVIELVLNNYDKKWSLKL